MDVEKLPGEAGSTVELDRVLLLADGDKMTLGNPTVAGAKVVAKIVETAKGDKIVVFKFKAKTRYRRKVGHRQPYTRLAITDILTGAPAKPRRTKKVVDDGT